jgi:hypothetical protein
MTWGRKPLREEAGLEMKGQAHLLARGVCGAVVGWERGSSLLSWSFLALRALLWAGAADSSFSSLCEGKQRPKLSMT